MSLELVLVRHGETAANRMGVIQGQLDRPLDETGIKQAECLGARLREEVFDRVYCSDLNRALVTAEKIVPPEKIIRMPELREWNLGSWQGRTAEEVMRESPETFAGFRNCDPNVEIPGGETFAEFRARVSGAVQTIRERNPQGGRILVVTHGGVLRILFLCLTGENNHFSVLPECSNCSVSGFRVKRGGWQLVLWNDTSHLRGISVLGNRL